jgi:hypothetical protein
MYVLLAWQQGVANFALLAFTKIWPYIELGQCHGGCGGIFPALCTILQPPPTVMSGRFSIFVDMFTYSYVVTICVFVLVLITTFLTWIDFLLVGLLLVISLSHFINSSGILGFFIITFIFIVGFINFIDIHPIVI